MGYSYRKEYTYTYNKWWFMGYGYNRLIYCYWRLTRNSTYIIFVLINIILHISLILILIHFNTSRQQNIKNKNYITILVNKSNMIFFNNTFR
jgi:hypothetical protein